jgi:hypothetical protein
MTKSGNFTLKKVTLGSMKILAAYQLTKLENISLGQAILNICTDEKSLREICGAVFQEDFSKVDFNEIDLEEVARGIGSFLQKLLNPTRN